jgi:hypothetical protein
MAPEVSNGARSHMLTEVLLKVEVSWHITPYRLIDDYEDFDCLTLKI